MAGRESGAAGPGSDARRGSATVHARHNDKAGEPDLRDIASMGAVRQQLERLSASSGGRVSVVGRGRSSIVRAAGAGALAVPPAPPARSDLIPAEGGDSSGDTSGQAGSASAPPPLPAAPERVPLAGSAAEASAASAAETDASAASAASAATAAKVDGDAGGKTPVETAPAAADVSGAADAGAGTPPGDATPARSGSASGDGDGSDSGGDEPVSDVESDREDEMGTGEESFVTATSEERRYSRGLKPAAARRASLQLARVPLNLAQLRADEAARTGGRPADGGAGVDAGVDAGAAVGTVGSDDAAEVAAAADGAAAHATNGLAVPSTRPAKSPPAGTDAPASASAAKASTAADSAAGPAAGTATAAATDGEAGAAAPASAGASSRDEGGARGGAGAGATSDAAGRGGDAATGDEGRDAGGAAGVAGGDDDSDSEIEDSLADLPQDLAPFLSFAEAGRPADRERRAMLGSTHTHTGSGGGAAGHSSSSLGSHGDRDRRRMTGSFASRSGGGRRSSNLYDADKYAQHQDSHDVVHRLFSMGHSFVRREIDEAEEFRKALPTMLYDVIKVNMRGRKQRRQVHFTSDAILNVRFKKGTVTRAHSYGDVLHVSLMDHQQFKIVYKNDHDFVYISPIAAQIVQELWSRVLLQRSVDKKKLTFNLALQFQQRLASASKREQERAKRDAMRRRGLRPDAAMSRKATKLMALTGETEVQRTSIAIQRMLYDRKTPEGRTRLHFINVDFKQCMKTPSTAPTSVRSFIDGMHEYILVHRRDMLERLRVDLDFEEDDVTSIMEKNKGLTDSVSQIVMQEVEKAVYDGVRDGVLRCVRDATDLAEQEALVGKMAALRDKPQSFYQIADAHQSTDDWSAAVLELTEMNVHPEPSAKLRALLSSAKAIYTSHSFDHSDDEGDSGGQFLSADDFLPILIFVVVQSELEAPLVTKNLLWSMCNPIALQSEGGYYLTVFEAALEYIRVVDLETGTVDALYEGGEDTSAAGAGHGGGSASAVGGGGGGGGDGDGTSAHADAERKTERAAGGDGADGASGASGSSAVDDGGGAGAGAGATDVAAA